MWTMYVIGIQILFPFDQIKYSVFVSMRYDIEIKENIRYSYVWILYLFDEY